VQKAQESTRSQTGLFFFRRKPGAPFAISSPGGGFSYVASVHEGFPYAVAISKQGCNAFVLKYRVGSGGALATRDLAAAISYVFRHAKKLGVGHRGLLRVGQFGGSTDGRGDRVARRRAVWRRRSSEAVSSGDGVHRPCGRVGERAAQVRRRR
jgi:hypothetical protein